MTTRTITGRSTRNSRNAGSVPGIAFGRTIPPRASTPCRLPSVPPSESRFEELCSEHRDGNQGDEHLGQGGDFGDGNPDRPGNDPPDDDGPGDHHDNEDPYGYAEISLLTGRTINHKTKPPARRIIITTIVITTRTRIKNPI